MGLKKILTILLSLIMLCSIGSFMACDNKPPETPPNQMEGVETITAIPNSSIVFSSTATDTATSSWNLSYGTTGIDVKVYVEDTTVYKSSENILKNDYVEIAIDKAQEVDGYSESTFLVCVDANGNVFTANLLSETEVLDSGITATAKEFSLDGQTKAGYYVTFTIPYVLTQISATEKDAVVCLGLFNADSSSSFSLKHYGNETTVNDMARTYALLEEDNVLSENPFFYKSIDGVKLDGVRDSAYGEFTDTVCLDDGRWYNISAVKTTSGVVVYSQGLFNTSKTNPYETDWGKVTNFEFTLNHGNVSYVTFNGAKQNVSEVFTSIEEKEGKYLHTVEFFVDKTLIFSWLEDGNVRLNYAWKTPEEKAKTISDLIDVRLNDWGSTDWHARHRLGGLATDEFNGEEVNAPYNLEIGNYGLQTVIPNASMTIDGNLTEYGEYSVTKGDIAKAVVELNGKVVDGGLYLAMTVTHSSWAEYNQMWYKNDNFEMKVNGEYVRIIFIDGKLIIPANVDAGASITTEEGGKLVTTVELFFEGNEKEYQVKIATCGAGFGVDFQPIFWDGGDTLFVDEDGIITIDGVLGETMWNVSSECSTPVNGANISVKATKMEKGVIFGIKVDHTKAPDVSVNGETNWWNYMGVELHFNGSATTYMTTCLNNENSKNLYPYCLTTKNADDTYTSIFEIYVEYAIIGTTADAELTFSVGGWYETDFAWLWGGNATTMTHKVTANGVVAIN